jgi:hypothetical protein
MASCSKTLGPGYFLFIPPKPGSSSKKKKKKNLKNNHSFANVKRKIRKSHTHFKKK